MGMAAEVVPMVDSLHELIVEALDEGLVVTDMEGRVIEANSAAVRITGMPVDVMRAAGPFGVPWHPYDSDGQPVPEERRPARRAMSSGLPQRHSVLGFERLDGVSRWVEMSSVPVSSVSGGPPELAVTSLRDVSDELSSGEEVRFQARLLDAVGDAIVGTDERLQICFWNRAAGELFGFAKDKTLGEHLGVILPAALAGGAGLDSARGDGPGLYEGELTVTCADGSTVPVSVTVSPAFDTDGRFCGAIAIGRDISERVRAAEMAERERSRAAAAERAAQQEAISRAAAEQANRAKSEFLSRMSHELRTPLNAVIGFGQILQLAKGLTDREAEGVEHILKAGKHLLDLINEVLDIARIETDQLNLSVEPVGVADVLGSAVDLLSPAAADRQIEVSCSVAEPELMVQADRQRLLQVALNLLSNAIKYNHHGGTVRVEATAVTDQRVRIEVIDTGVGIAAKVRDRLFTPFDRLGADQLGIEGTGVGLALSKGLVERMGGQLGVTSYEGEGSTFWIDLERATVALVTDAPPPVEDPEPDDRNLIVLYIEDNMPNLKVVESMLAVRHQVTLLSAMQGRLGLELARQHHPQLILLDVHLPEMDGAEILRAVRSDLDLHDCVVAVISADATAKQIQRMTDLGADHYLTKPFDMATLLDIVDAVDQAHRAQL